MANDFQDRFVFNLTDSQSTVTIHHSQRSDSGTYELIVSPDDFAATIIKDSVKISVKCKYIVFPYFLVETSTIILIIIITIIIIIIMIIIIIIIMMMMMMMIVNMIVMIFTLRLVVL